MKKNYLILLLPLVILMFVCLTIASLNDDYWSLWVTIYLALISLVGIFAAYQSLVIQSSINWGAEDMDKDEIDELAIAVVQDFVFFFIIYCVILTIIYLLIYWITVAIVNS